MRIGAFSTQTPAELKRMGLKEYGRGRAPKMGGSYPHDEWSCNCSFINHASKQHCVRCGVFFGCVEQDKRDWLGAPPADIFVHEFDAVLQQNPGTLQRVGAADWGAAVVATWTPELCRTVASWLDYALGEGVPVPIVSAGLAILAPRPYP